MSRALDRIAAALARDVDPEAVAVKVVAQLAARGVHRWNEDMAWRYLREWFPRAPDDLLQQFADRAQLIMQR